MKKHQHKIIICLGLALVLNCGILAKNSNTTKRSTTKKQIPEKNNTTEKTSVQQKRAEVSSPQEIELPQPSIKLNEDILENIKSQPLIQ